MNNALKDNRDKFVLIGKIKGLAAESRRARNRVLTAKNEKTANEMAFRKRTIGYNVRHHLLAMSFLKGLPYFRIEKKCREDNKPNSNLILEIIQAHAPRFIFEKAPNGYPFFAYKVTLDDVNHWIEGTLS